VEKQRDERTKMKQPTLMYAKILSLDPHFLTCEKYLARTQSLEHYLNVGSSSEFINLSISIF
jgi:hypothetical protein